MLNDAGISHEISLWSNVGVQVVALTRPYNPRLIGIDLRYVLKETRED